MVDSFATQPIAPVNPVIGVRPVEVAAPNQQATATQTQLAVLPSGTIIEGFVLKRDNQNNPILRTPIGDLQLQSEVFLKTGSQVIFRVDSTTASRARIVTIDGLEPDDYAALSTKSLNSDTIETSPIPPRAQPQTTPTRREPANNATLPALLLNKAATANPTQNPQLAALIDSATPLSPELQKMVSGSALKITVLDLQFPRIPPAAAAPGEAPPLPTAAPNNPSLPPSSSPASPMAPPPFIPSTAPVIQTFAESMLMSQASPAFSTQPVPTTPASNPVNIPTAALATPGSPSPNAASPNQPPANIPTLTATPSPLPTTIPPSAIPAAPASTSNATSIASSTTPTTAPITTALPPPLAPIVPAPLNVTPATTTAKPVPLPSAPALLAATPPSEPTLSPPTPTAIRQTIPGLQAVVIGHEPDGGNVLHSDLGTIKLFTPRPLPVGSTLTLDIKPDESVPRNPVASNGGSSPLPPITFRSRDWPLLNEIATPNSADATPAATPPLVSQVPVANTALASGLLGFMAAVKSGDVRQWIGTRALEKLSADFPKLAARLKTDVEQMQDMWNNSPLQSWSSMLLPINVQGQIEHARLYMRDEESNSEAPNKSGGGGQRFIIEVNLSHLGDMQMDGFVQNQSAKQFDLVIRTSRAIEPTLANEIRGIFEAAARSTGYAGQLSFQRGEQHFVRPQADIKTNLNDFHTILA